LVLDDVGVSRMHAEIRRVGGSCVIADLGSVNGTVVNGRREIQHVLHDGDVVRLGSVELTYRVIEP
jgi:pSer/pThr/pTyr-binding forkhead associated (FHA) protein